MADRKLSFSPRLAPCVGRTTNPELSFCTSTTALKHGEDETIKKDLVAQVSFIRPLCYRVKTALALGELIAPVRGRAALPRSLAQFACRRY